jgi:hypothetical protein
MFRFTIRDVLCLTVLVALSLALWRNHSKLAEVRNHAWVLRYNLGLAKIRYEQLGGDATQISRAVQWNLVDEPIP